MLSGLRHWCDVAYDDADGSIHYSENGGVSWTQADTPEGMQVVGDLKFDSVEANVFYAGTSDGFYRSEDSGQTWVRVEGEISKVVPGKVGSIAVEPEPETGTEHHIVILDGETIAILVSSNQGEDWNAVSFQDPGDNFGQFIFAPTDPPILYAASRTGLRYSKDYGKTWTRAAGDLGYVNVIALEAVKEDDRVILYAATPGGYAARTDQEMITTAGLGTRDATNLVHPGVYRFTQLPTNKFYLPLILQ